MFSCMRTNHLRDELSARFNVAEMPRKIEIEVPEEFYAMLEEQAAAEGIPFTDLVKRELGVIENPLSFKEISARIKARGPSKGTAAETVQIIREGRGEI
jgi:hypothetical protein